MTCAKRVVRCYLHDKAGTLIATGSNACHNPQPECPRQPGEGYQKCRDICQQVGHAETVALMNASGYDLTGGKAVIVGHTRVCVGCREELEMAGVTRVEFA